MLYTNQTGVGQFISAFGQGFVQTRLDILFVFLITIALLLFFFNLLCCAKEQSAQDNCGAFA